MRIVNTFLRVMLVLCLLVNSIVIFGQVNNDSFIRKVVEEYNSYNSISYRINYEIKTFSRDSPLRFNGTCKIFRKPKDTIFGGLIKFSVFGDERLIEKAYDLNASYNVNHKSKSITKYFVNDGFAKHVMSQFDWDVTDTYFINVNRIMENLNDTTVNVRIIDTIINNKNYIFLKFKYKDEGEYSNVYRIFLINKLTHVIEFIYFSASDNFQNQTNKWEILNVKFDDFTESELWASIDALNHLYNCLIYTDRLDSLKLQQSLKIGTKIPEYIGFNFIDSTKINSEYPNRRMSILYFFYMSCGPCTKLIPTINDLYTNYKDSIFFLGLNSIDNNSEKFEKIYKHIEHFKISYPIILIDDQTLKNFKILYYPTIIVVDREGIIRNILIGNSENVQLELEQSIKIILR